MINTNDNFKPTAEQFEEKQSLETPSFNKQLPSLQMQNTFLEQTVAKYKKKCQVLMEINRNHEQRISQLILETVSKDKNIRLLQEELINKKHSYEQLQNTSVNLNVVENQQKQIVELQMDLQQSKKKAFDSAETVQSLIHKLFQYQQEIIGQKQIFLKEVQLLNKQSKLLTSENQELRLKVEELLTQLKSAENDLKLQYLMEYEEGLAKRVYKPLKEKNEMQDKNTQELVTLLKQKNCRIERKHKELQEKYRRLQSIVPRQ